MHFFLIFLSLTIPSETFQFLFYSSDMANIYIFHPQSKAAYLQTD